MKETVELKYDYRIEMIAPDEGVGPTKHSAWQFLIFGTPDKYWETEGDCCFPETRLNTLLGRLKSTLYNSVSSSVVDETWPKIEEALTKLYNAYRAANGPYWIDHMPEPEGEGLGKIRYSHIHTDMTEHPTEIETPSGGPVDAGWVSTPGEFDRRVKVVCQDCNEQLRQGDLIEVR